MHAVAALGARRRTDAEHADAVDAAAPDPDQSQAARADANSRMDAEHAGAVGHQRAAENAMTTGLIGVARRGVTVVANDAVGIMGAGGTNHPVGIAACIRECGHGAPRDADEWIGERT